MFKFLEDHCYTMPTNFIGWKGTPSQTTYHDVCAIQIDYETDGSSLDNYIPEAFRLTEPVVSIMYCMCRGCDWLAGGSYALVAVNVPVAYILGRERLEGMFALVLWENMTDPILTGRDNGMPKVFADIEDLHQLGDRVFANLSHGGTTFLRLDFRKTDRLGADDLVPQHLNWFGWRFVPNIGGPGAALSQPTLFPQDFTWREGWRGAGTVVWDPGAPEQHPMQFPIIKALSSLPVKAYRGGSMKLGANVLREDLARALGAETAP